MNLSLRGLKLIQQTPTLTRSHRKCCVRCHLTPGTAGSRWRDITSVPTLETVNYSPTLAVRDMLLKLSTTFFFTVNHFLYAACICY